MEAVAGSWVFAVFMGIFVLFLIVQLIKTIWKEQNKPIDPNDKIAGRKLLIDLLFLQFGSGKKDHYNDQINPEMKEEENSDQGV